MVELFTYTIFSLIFSSTYQLSGPNETGLNAKTFVYEDSGKENLAITFVLFPVDAQEDMQMNDSELLNYAKTIFLGTSKAASSFKERNILGKKSSGELLSTKIPVASDLEIHFITLKSGEKLCIGFKSIKELEETIRESIIVEILESLKEES